MMHRAGALFDEDEFDGDENAIVDFKYSASDKLTWWFDHHKSAFLSADDEAHFAAYTGGKKFLNADYKSCTKFIADTAAERFGFDPAPMSELIHWANLIDSAAYKNAAEPVEMEAPAFKLALVIECDRDPALAMKIITDLQTGTMQEVATSPYVQERIAPLYQRHLQAIETIKQATCLCGPVVNFDISAHGNMEGYSKFIPYYLHPEATYSIGVSLSPFRAKISVGSNPWAPRPRTHDLAQICERYGGGGHAVVAAISLAPESIEDARRIAEDIVQELQN